MLEAQRRLASTGKTRRASPAPATWPSTPREKAQQLGAKVVAVSDSTGWVYDPGGHRPRAAQADQGSGARPPHASTPTDRPSAEYHEGRRRSGTSPATSRCPAPPRTSCTWTTPRPSIKNGCHSRRRGRQHAHHPRGHRVLAGARRRCSPRARRPTPAAWPPPAWRCPRTPMRLSWTFEEVDAKLQGHHGRTSSTHADDAAKRVRP